MKTLRYVQLVLVVVTLAACADGAPAPVGRASSAPAVDARARLAASTAGLSAGNYRFKAVMPSMTIDGTVHLPSGSWAERSVADGGRKVIDTVVIGKDQYARTTPGRPWEHSDQSRVPENASVLHTNPDHTGATGLLATVQTAKADGSTISGMLDGSSMAVPGRALNAVSERMREPLAFTATLDDSGRLVRLVVSLPERPVPPLPAGTWTLDVADYGAAAAQKAPASFTELPGDLYQTP